jgi:hypothetical protein
MECGAACCCCSEQCLAEGWALAPAQFDALRQELKMNAADVVARCGHWATHLVINSSFETHLRQLYTTRKSSR